MRAVSGQRGRRHVVVEGDGILFAKHLAEKFDAKVQSHERFGTSVVILPDGNRIDIHVVAYEEWGPFKNKEGMETFKDGFAFSTFLEKKNF